MAALHLLQQKLNPPKDNVDPDAFKGRTLLITGATTGLGLEAAKKIVLKGAKKVIITARDANKGATAKSVLQSVAKAAKRNTEIDVMSLNMSTTDGVKAFADEITTKHVDLDTAILNAGTLQSKWTSSAEGYEETVQVNAISTVLLGVLLLPTLVRNSTLKQPAHLTFVSSGTILRIKAAECTTYAGTEILRTMSDKKAWPGGQPQYARSKLVLEHAMRHIAQLPQLRSDAGGVKVIVNSTCPGMCKSDLARQYITNIFIKTAVWVLMTVVARTTEQGSRSYVSAVTRGDDSQGQLWKDDKYYVELGEMVETAEGHKLGDEAWKELVEIMRKTDPVVSSILQDK